MPRRYSKNKISNQKNVDSKKKATESISGKSTKQIISDLGIDDLPTENYIESDFDQANLFSVKPVNVLGKILGKGLFATQDIQEKQCVGCYTGTFFSQRKFKEHLKSNAKATDAYSMTVGRGIIDASDFRNYSAYINYSDTQPNVEFLETPYQGSKIAKIITTQAIAKDEQILVDYNVFDENISKHYTFLNPQDNWKSAAELYNENRQYYQLMTVPFDLPVFSLTKGEQLYATQLGISIFENNRLPRLKKNTPLTTPKLPFLRSGINNSILDFDQSDVFSPLMLACYLGQHSSVQWLIDKKANINRQQHGSGNCSLFCVLAGYSARDKDKQVYVGIIKSLINAGANLVIHDRQDNTFLHQAITVLSAEDFNSVLAHLKSKPLLDVTNLLFYINEHEDDLFLSCLRYKRFDHAKALVDQFTAEKIIELDYNKERMLKIFSEYSGNDLDSMVAFFEKIGIDDIVKQLDIDLSEKKNHQF